MSIVNIYGPIDDESGVIIAAGNYNSVHAVLTYHANEDLLQITQIKDVIPPSVMELMIKYEYPEFIEKDPKKIYFTLRIKDSEKYIGVIIDANDSEKIARTHIGTEKVYFSVDYSHIDNISRDKLLAGSFYALETIYGEQKYTVSWKIEGYANGDLIMFLPTTWYEKDENGFCSMHNRVNNLIENLNQLYFKGYTTLSWCEDASHAVNCTDNNFCGECMGRCRNPDQLCYPHKNKFLCSASEPLDFHSSAITMAQSSSSYNAITWLIIIAVVIVICGLVYGLTTKNRSYNTYSSSISPSYF